MAKGRRRNTKSKTTYKSKRKNNKQEINLSVIGTIVFSVLLAVLLYTNSGEIGQKLNEVLGGLMGILIITNLRVLYYYGPNKDNWTLDQIPVDTIESIEFSRSYTSSYLSVYGKSSIFHLNSDRHVLMEKARDLINQMIYDKSQNSESSESESSVSDNMAQAAEALKSLKELLDSGIITQEEFDAKKKQLLGL